MIRAAIVGIGRWGRTLVNSVQGKSSAIRFTAGCTRTRASAEEFCAANGITLKDDLGQILADPAIDAVVFATPHSQHGAQVERAAAAGKHVLMEKPFTLDVASAKAALDGVARSGILLGVAFPRRFHPAMIELKARIADGRLGTLSHCESAQASPTGLTMPPDYWRSDPREAPAGAMTATGVHNLDAVIYLFGKIEEVYCRSLPRVMPRLEDTTTVHVGPRERDVGHPLLFACHSAELPLCGLRHQGLGRARDTRTRIPLYAGDRAAAHRPAQSFAARDHRI
ncbi:MAG: Gfo/Idh/MocA family oxidoreductase [Alphaproteobacteria bacterium]|nr:Gfo/Idh/MocA family oxidoreductase [Alphaproteobacteria bacterium]MBV9375100.1 Gfo/Idh/MocA family oxidoreductase [Alphaproteobacteria bacterium]